MTCDAAPEALPGSAEVPLAEALCDLVADPSAGITRVRLVGARDTRLEAVEKVAARRGLLAQVVYGPGPDRGSATLERDPWRPVLYPIAKPKPE